MLGIVVSLGMKQLILFFVAPTYTTLCLVPLFSNSYSPLSLLAIIQPKQRLNYSSNLAVYFYIGIHVTPKGTISMGTDREVDCRFKRRLTHFSIVLFFLAIYQSHFNPSISGHSHLLWWELNDMDDVFLGTKMMVMTLLCPCCLIPWFQICYCRWLSQMPFKHGGISLLVWRWSTYLPFTQDPGVQYLYSWSNCK